MKANAYSTVLVLRAGAEAMRQHGAPVHSIGRMLALAEEAEKRPAQFPRLAGAVLVAMAGEPAGCEAGHVELAAYQAAFGGRS